MNKDWKTLASEAFQAAKAADVETSQVQAFVDELHEEWEAKADLEEEIQAEINNLRGKYPHSVLEDMIGRNFTV